MLSVVFMFVSDASGDHMVETYSSMGLVMAYALSVSMYVFPVCMIGCLLLQCLCRCALMLW